MDKYKYVQAEFKLAGLLGYHQITDGHFSDNRLSAMPRGSWIESLQVVLPMWTRDNAAAFELMVEHGLYPIDGDDHGTEYIWVFQNLKCLASVDVDEHPSKEAAVRYAIVMAVIAKLEAK